MTPDRPSVQASRLNLGNLLGRSRLSAVPSEKTEKRAVLVLGGTGLVGGAVTRGLLTYPWFRVVVATRRPWCAEAMLLRQAGAHVVEVDFNYKHSLVMAMQGVKCVFLHTAYWENYSCTMEIMQGRNAVEAAVEAGVRHLVFDGSNYQKPEKGRICSFMQSKLEIEEFIKASGITYTIVVLPFYFENFLTVFRPFEIHPDFYAITLPLQNCLLSCACLHDMALCICKIIQQGETYYEEKVVLGAEMLSVQQMISNFNDTLKGITFIDPELTIEDFQEFEFLGAKDLAAMFLFYQQCEHIPDFSVTRALNPNTRNMVQWIKDNEEQLYNVLDSEEAFDKGDYQRPPHLSARGGLPYESPESCSASISFDMEMSKDEITLIVPSRARARAQDDGTPSTNFSNNSDEDKHDADSHRRKKSFEPRRQSRRESVLKFMEKDFNTLAKKLSLRRHAISAESLFPKKTSLAQSEQGEPRALSIKTSAPTFEDGDQPFLPDRVRELPKSIWKRVSLESTAVAPSEDSAYAEGPLKVVASDETTQPTPVESKKRSLLSTEQQISAPTTEEQISAPTTEQQISAPMTEQISAPTTEQQISAPTEGGKVPDNTPPQIKDTRKRRPLHSRTLVAFNYSNNGSSQSSVALPTQDSGSPSTSAITHKHSMLHGAYDSTKRFGLPTVSICEYPANREFRLPAAPCRTTIGRPPSVKKVEAEKSTIQSQTRVRPTDGPGKEDRIRHFGTRRYQHFQDKKTKDLPTASVRRRRSKGKAYDVKRGAMDGAQYPAGSKSTKFGELSRDLQVLRERADRGVTDLLERFSGAADKSKVSTVLTVSKARSTTYYTTYTDPESYKPEELSFSDSTETSLSDHHTSLTPPSLESSPSTWTLSTSSSEDSFTANHRNKLRFLGRLLAQTGRRDDGHLHGDLDDEVGGNVSRSPMRHYNSSSSSYDSILLTDYEDKATNSRP